MLCINLLSLEMDTGRYHIGIIGGCCGLLSVFGFLVLVVAGWEAVFGFGRDTAGSSSKSNDEFSPRAGCKRPTPPAACEDPPARRTRAPSSRPVAMAARRVALAKLPAMRLVVLLLLALAAVTRAAKCRQDYFVNNSVCVQCDAGRYRPAGDDTTAGDTDCLEIDGCADAQRPHTCDGFCFDDEAYTANSFPYSCHFFYINEYCDDGGPGPAWEAAWDFDDYANPSNGLSPLEACCDCGGGSGLYYNDSDRDATCVDIPAPGEGFACSCSLGWDYNPAEAQSCRPILCLEDFRVQDKACVPCEPGKAHAAGAAAIYRNTACYNVSCAFNEYVSNHTCTACAPGYTNAAGDNAADVDTACEVWICAEDERVLFGACVGCSYGGVRAAGDNATLDDTECFFDTCEVDQCVVARPVQQPHRTAGMKKGTL